MRTSFLIFFFHPHLRSGMLLLRAAVFPRPIGLKLAACHLEDDVLCFAGVFILAHMSVLGKTSMELSEQKSIEGSLEDHLIGEMG